MYTLNEKEGEGADGKHIQSAIRGEKKKTPEGNSHGMNTGGFL